MKESTPTVQVAYEVIKMAKEPLTQPEIMDALVKHGRKASGTIIYPLLERGLITKATKQYEGKSRTAYVATAAVAEFGARRHHRTRRKNKANKLAIQSAADSPAIEIRTPEQETAELQHMMGISYNAIRSLQNTVATLKFAEMLEQRGPEQMLLMLAGLEHMK